VFGCRTGPEPGPKAYFTVIKRIVESDTHDTVSLPMIALAYISIVLAQTPAPQDNAFELQGKNYRLEVTPMSPPKVIVDNRSGNLSQNAANQSAQTSNRRYRITGNIDGQHVDEIATGRTITDISGITSLTTVTQFESASGIRFQVRRPVPGRTVTQQILNAPVFMPDLSSIQAWAMNRYRERRAKELSMVEHYGFKSESEMKGFLGQNGSKIRAAEKRGSPDAIGEVLEDQRAKGRYPRVK